MERMAQAHKTMLDAHDKQIDAKNTEMNKINYKLSNLTNTVNEHKHLNGIINTITLSMIEFDKIHQKILSIYSKNINTQMLNLINFEFDKINKQLEPNFMLPPMKSIMRERFLKSTIQ